jgi:O-antigen ligase
VSPFAGTEARASTGQSLSTNGGHRLDDWRWGVRVFEHWPWSGTGFHGFAGGSRQVAGQGSGSLTPFAHNGFLQVLVDGGLLLAVPVLVALLLLVLGCARSMWAARTTRDWKALGAGIAVLVLAAHSAVDFDWTYPALLSGFALAGALAVPLLPVATDRVGLRRRVASGCLLGLITLAAVAAWSGDLVLNVPLGGHA